MRIKFVDLNHSLVEKVKAIGIETLCGDYFTIAYKEKQPVLMTASNPNWTFGGGIDAHFAKHFPELIRYKQIVGGEMERRFNICFCITVDNSLKANREQIKKAIQFAMDNTYEGETLLLSGVGTGIGANSGFTEDDFVEVLKELTNK